MNEIINDGAMLGAISGGLISGLSGYSVLTGSLVGASAGILLGAIWTECWLWMFGELF
jgi:hypothetical protein